MPQRFSVMKWSLVLALPALLALGVSCRPSDVLSVPPPIGVLESATDAAGAEAELTGGIGTLSQGVTAPGYLLEFSSLLTDEMHYASFTSFPSLNDVAADARDGAVGTLAETGPAYGPLLTISQSRAQLLIARAAMQKFEPGSGHIGLAYALAGYSEVFLAESYCAGIPLSTVIPGGGWQYGTPLTTDALLDTAEAHFDSALKYAASNDTVTSLASVGLGRTRLDRANFSGAAQAVAGVPIGFVYALFNGGGGSANNLVDMYSNVTLYTGCSYFNVADVEGGTGLNFVSALDPRLVFSTTVDKTCDGGTWYYPTKFGNPSTSIPIATGVEAQLIAAEAALHSGNATAWLADLSALRANASATYLTLAAPVPAFTGDTVLTGGLSADAQVDVMFRERAFWLYGTLTRLGGLRRLIRQYGRDASTVFPTGTYVGGESPGLSPPIPNYGTDVSFMIPTRAAGQTPNASYQGCLSPPSTA
jgi:starch-binding outer membrane protein, SusD/RagB family